VKPDELARYVLRLAMEGERDPIQLHDGALQGLIPATAWREGGVTASNGSDVTKTEIARDPSCWPVLRQAPGGTSPASRQS
jgi:hypothetical protein